MPPDQRLDRYEKTGGMSHELQTDLHSRPGWPDGHFHRTERCCNGDTVLVLEGVDVPFHYDFFSACRWNYNGLDSTKLFRRK
jgi:hypothetical protein